MNIPAFHGTAIISEAALVNALGKKIDEVKVVVQRRALPAWRAQSTTSVLV